MRGYVAKVTLLYNGELRELASPKITGRDYEVSTDLSLVTPQVDSQYMFRLSKTENVF